MRTFIRAASLSLALLSPLTIADNIDGLYLGVGWSQIDSNVSDANGNGVTYKGAEFFGGYKFNPYLGVEARVGTGLSETDFVVDTAPDPDTTAESSIDSYAAIYYRPESSNEVAKIYALIGIAHMETTTDPSVGPTTSASDTGLSYGLGVGFVLNQYFNLNFEYRTLLDTTDDDDSDTDFEFTSLGATVDFRF